MEETQADYSRDQRPIIIASNRGPVSFSRDENGDLLIHRGSGGLVSALSGLASQIDATWISCAMSEVDTSWQGLEVPLESEKGGSLRIEFVTPEPKVYNGYYNVISNPLLWFLQHSMWDLPRAPLINRATWIAWENGYVAVNQMFAHAIAKQARSLSGNPIIMLQDYHLYLAARFFRELYPHNTPTIMFFIHIPWPGPEYWRILPPTMRHAILNGLCAVDLLGFQTRDDGLNFIRTCETFLPKASVNYKRGRVWYRNHSSYVRDFPISIEVDAIQQRASSPETVLYQKEIEDITGDRQLILRIDRIEPSKNIIRGFQAFEEMLELHSEHLRRVTFLALLVPSRMEVDEYQNYLNELMAAAGRINALYGDSEWEPVRILVGENYPRALAALRNYDVLLVNAIADGMNLVAKEGPIVNQKTGVLILSERAGAVQQLESGAMVISPCDIYATAEAIHQALIMTQDEREERACLLRWLIEQEDINAWLEHQLDTLAELNL